MVKACVFDAYGTLFNLHLPSERLQAVAGDRSDALLDLWRRKQLEYTWLRTLMGRYRPFEQVTEDALRHAFATFGVDHPPLFEALMQTYWQPTPFPEVKDVLHQLRKRGLTTVILSNGSPALLKSGLKHAGLTDLLDYVLSAHTVSHFKVHPKVYQLAEDSLDLYPEELTFQSSNAWDIAGATAYGFTTVWVNRQGQPAEALDLEPHHQVSDLTGLVGVLDALPQ